MENLLDCNICLEKYNTKEKMPRILKCGHTFCSKCLKELTKINNGEQVYPFIKCPMDKLMGHQNTDIEEIPINRIIVDFLDYNGFQMDKLSLNDKEQNSDRQYIKTAYDKLKSLEKIFNSTYGSIRDNILNFITVKNNSINEVNDHFNKIINIIEEKKSESIHKLENFCKMKLGLYNDALTTLENFRDLVKVKVSKLESFKSQNIMANMPMIDELTIINELELDKLENKDFNKEIEMIMEEMNGDNFLPKILIKNEFQGNLIELTESLKIVLPVKSQSSELKYLNEDLENLSLNSQILWFQQNSKNIYKLFLNENDWLYIENRDNFQSQEMFRVCMLGNEEALITGGIKGFMATNLTYYFKRGNFKKKQNMFYERRTHACCKAGEFVFACGGINSKQEPLSACEKFSLEYGKWIKIANMPTAKSHLSLCSYNNEFIFSIGGENRYESLLDSIERYSITMDAWETMSVKVPLKVECVGLVQFNKEILILGGFSCECGSLASVFAYVPDKKEVRQVAKELEHPGWSIYQPVRLGNSVHVFFGGEDEFPPQNLVYNYQKE